jgi:hypothetical protein
VDVCLTLRFGKQPILKACNTIENDAEIIAWLAIIEATTAKRNVGQYKGPI